MKKTPIPKECKSFFRNQAPFKKGCKQRIKILAKGLFCEKLKMVILGTKMGHVSMKNLTSNVDNIEKVGYNNIEC